MFFDATIVVHECCTQWLLQTHHLGPIPHKFLKPPVLDYCWVQLDPTQVDQLMIYFQHVCLTGKKNKMK